MNTCVVRFPHHLDVRAERGPIRWELFLDWDIRDVLLTERADTLRILFRGEPDTRTWSRLITDAGYPPPSFGPVEALGTETDDPIAA